MMKKNKSPSHGVQLLIRAVVKDPDGKILSDTGQKPSKSFLIQFLEFIHYLLRYSVAGEHDATDTSEVESIIYEGGRIPAQQFRVDAGINVSDYGIVVGTGETGETNVDFNLETQLTEGVGLGNITHGAMVVETTAVVGANVDLEMKRSFPNNTGSTITIKEAGVYVRYLVGALIHCIIRDVLGTPVEVPDACALTVYYTLRTTV